MTTEITTEMECAMCGVSAGDDDDEFTYVVADKDLEGWVCAECLPDGYTPDLPLVLFTAPPSPGRDN